MEQKYKPKHAKRKLIYILPLTLIIIGILVIVTITVMDLNARQKQQALIDAYISNSASKNNADPAGNDNLEKNPDLKSNNARIDTEDTSSQQNNPAIETIAILSIPRVNLTLAVAKGVGDDVLKYALGHYEDTAMPGQPGNFSVIGHRNYAFGKFLNRLDEVEAGDNIIVNYQDKKYEYIVTDILVVEPTDTWVLDPTHDAQITLITCTPIRLATHRLIVKGVLKT